MKREIAKLEEIDKQQDLIGREMSIDCKYPINVTEDFKKDSIIGQVKRIIKDNLSLIGDIFLKKKIDSKDKVFRIGGQIQEAEKKAKDDKIITEITKMKITEISLISKDKDVYV